MLKDNLKFFSETDGYNTVLTKADYDNNLETVANAVDAKLEANIVTSDEKFKRYIRAGSIDTADGTETVILSLLNLPNSSIVAVDVYSQNMQDDDSTKWIFRGVIFANIDGSGNITVDSNLTDVVKDDTNWNFAVAGNSGDGTASMDLKVTGVDGANIGWSIFADIKVRVI